MSNGKRVLLSIAIVILLVFSLVMYLPAETGSVGDNSGDIVILYTNDVHTYIDKSLSYDTIAAIKKEFQNEYEHVFLVDAGDHIQGTAYGSMDKGETIIELMNKAGYDIATLGNHEFDYGMFGCMNVIDKAEFTYVSCNFYNETAGVRGENVLDSYVIMDCGNEKIAFIGITTPETFTKSTPAYFMNEKGEFIYGIAGEDDGSGLYANVQAAVDEAKATGATTIIALGHLGVDESSIPWRSVDTINNVSGIDAFIDGHSHTIIEGEEIEDKDGNTVLLTQTGQYFDRIGVMIIDAETGDITTDFIETIETEGTEESEPVVTITSDIYAGTSLISDESVKTILDSWYNTIEEELGQVIGRIDVTLDNYDAEGNRLVRMQETNSGDFSADALYYLFDNMDLDVDIAITNGGGVRNTALTGEITYKSCKDMHPFGNVACLQTVTGQQILDMLEFGARNVGVAEDGSFLHVAGVTYEIDATIPDTTKADEVGVWVEGPSEYRVKNIKVYNKDTDTYEDIDLDAEYNLAGFNYTLRDLGGGFAMLNGAVNVLDYVMEDYQVLANYIVGFEDSTVLSDNSPLLDKYENMLIDYSDVNGSGRITIVK